MREKIGNKKVMFFVMFLMVYGHDFVFVSEFRGGVL